MLVRHSPSGTFYFSFGNPARDQRNALCLCPYCFIAFPPWLCFLRKGTQTQRLVVSPLFVYPWRGSSAVHCSLVKEGVWLRVGGEGQGTSRGGTSPQYILFTLSPFTSLRLRNAGTGPQFWYQAPTTSSRRTRAGRLDTNPFQLPHITVSMILLSFPSSSVGSISLSSFYKPAV